MQIREIPLPIYKPVEIWHCAGVQEALNLCKEHSGEESWVYLEIETTEYIHEEDMKAMKTWKSDILSIRPIIKDTEGKTIGSPDEQHDLPFETMVQEFYRRRFHMDMEEEAMALLMEIMGEEEEA